MKKIRKVNKLKKKEKRKEAEGRLQTQAALMTNHPQECCVCNTAFQRSHESVKTWQVTVVGERVRFTCPPCWHRVKEAVRCQE